MSRLRRTVLLALCALVVAGLAALSVADPFHLRHARWFTASLVLLAILLGTAALAVAVPRGVLRVLAVVLGAVAALGWVAVVVFAAQLVPDPKTVSETAEGGKRLVVLEGAPFTIDPVYAVVVRAGGGPFEQETLVYQGVQEAPAPSEVRFVDAGDVEVRTPGGCTYRSRVEPVTLAVDPVHRPLQLGTC